MIPKFSSHPSQEHVYTHPAHSHINGEKGGGGETLHSLLAGSSAQTVSQASAEPCFVFECWKRPCSPHVSAIYAHMCFLTNTHARIHAHTDAHTQTQNAHTHTQGFLLHLGLTDLGSSARSHGPVPCDWVQSLKSPTETEASCTLLYSTIPPFLSA